MRSPSPGEEPEVGLKEQSWQGLNTHQVFCHVLHLGGPDLVMNLAHGLAIGCSDNGGHGERVSSLATLNIGQHVHLLKEDEVLAAPPSDGTRRWVFNPHLVVPISICGRPFQYEV